MAKSSASKQKRARENRAQRAALEARRKAAAVPIEERVATKAKATPPTSRTSAKGGGKGERPARAPFVRPGSSPVDVATLQGSWFSKVNQVPGGREVLMTVLLTVVMTAMVAFTPLFVPEGAAKDAKPTLTIFDSLGATAALVLAVPLVLVGFAAAMSLHPRRRTAWYVTLLGLGAFVAFGASVGIFYLFPAGFMMWAIWRAAKIEGSGPSLLRRAAAAGALGDAEDDADD